MASTPFSRADGSAQFSTPLRACMSSMYRSGDVTATSVKSEKVRVPLGAKLVTGAIAGIVGTVSIFPIDMVKTRLQNQVVRPDGSRMYRNPIHCFRSILAKEGAAGLYKGITANLIGVTPEKAIKLAVNDLVREHLEEEDGSISVTSEMIAGGSAGFFQVAATNPMEITKIRMQLAGLKGETLSVAGAVRELGFRGLYTGVTATWCRDIPYSICFFPTYANVKKALAGPNGETSVGGVLFAGGSSAAFAAFLCTPQDVIKTRLQVKGAELKYNGSIDCLKKIVAEEGFAALYKGAVPRMTVQAPLFGIALLAFELQKKYVKSQMQQ